MPDDYLQENLFGTTAACPDIGNLPLIINPNNDCEVLAPGSVYQPLLLDQLNGNVDAGPGKLNKEEEAFVRDFIKFLYPANDPPLSAKTPLAWGEKQVWLKRNIEKNTQSFRLRVDSSDWYYPDFVIWIIDPVKRTQTFGFVDPKGLALGVFGGWQDYKIVATQYMPHTLTSAFSDIDHEGEPWKFRVRGALVSTTTFESLREQAKFRVFDAAGNRTKPTEAQFNQARIVFQKAGTVGYIEQVLSLLMEDNALDEVFGAMASANDKSIDHKPKSEIECDIALRISTDSQTISDLVGTLVEEYSATSGNGQLGAYAMKRRLDEWRDLMDSGSVDKAVESGNDGACRRLWRHQKGI